MEFVASEEPQAKIQTQGGMELSYLPTDKVKIMVDSATVVNNGTIPKGMEGQILKEMQWKINKQYIMKNDLMIMDIIATNNWKRPIYFSVTVGDDAYMNLEPYFQLEGLAYRLVPMLMQTNDGQTGKANTSIMYNNMMNKFKWGGMSTEGVYMDENNLRMTMNLRNNFARLADALLAEGKTEEAKKALALCMKEMPRKNIPYNYFMLPIAEVYYKLGMSNEANQLIKDIANIYEEDLKYYFRFKGKLAENIDSEKQQAMAVMQRIGQVARMNKQETLAKDLDERFKKLTAGFSEGM
jgi:tetratricopeptide (TPR) repeat protein